jgi:hypothetical protein
VAARKGRNQCLHMGTRRLPILMLVLSCLVLSCLVLSCLVLSCLVLSCLVLSCLAVLLSCSCSLCFSSCLVLFLCSSFCLVSLVLLVLFVEIADNKLVMNLLQSFGIALISIRKHLHQDAIRTLYQKSIAPMLQLLVLLQRQPSKLQISSLP